VVEIVKRYDLHKFVVLPKRWIVERLFDRLEELTELDRAVALVAAPMTRPVAMSSAANSEVVP
jgi:hypothetical protein